MPDTSSVTNTRAALDAWVLATLPRAVAFARSLVRDHATADDVVHDCYCRILQKSAVYNIPRDGTKILYRAITNDCINRAGSRRLVELGALGDEDWGFIDRRAVQPLDDLVGRETADLLSDGLKLLSVPQRAALELKSLGMSLQEIADALETTANNAGVLVHRARQTLSRYLAEKEGQLS